MMNLFKRITVFAVVFVCCFTCNYSLTAANKPTEYTVILYLNGCDLEHRIDSATGKPYAEATKALNALTGSFFDDSKLNVIVITGGTKKWIMEDPKISTTQCQAWRIWGTPDKRMELVADTEPGMKMMDKDTLAGYIEWAIKEYPAKKYILIMWDHGGGPIGGFGTDELDNNKSISISDIQEALKKSLGAKKLELMIFACCLMGNFETAYKVKDYANYMVASEELSYGDAFGGLIKELANNPSISGKNLGKLFIDAHFDVNYGDGSNGMYTFSLTDLSKIEQVKNNWDTMIRQLAEKMKGKSKNSADMYRYLAIARAFSESYNEFAREFNGITDMYCFAELISEKCNVKTDELRKSIRDAVLYKRVCSLRPYSNGLSIFFPDRKLDPNLGLQNDLEIYKPNCFSETYYNFITNKEKKTGYYDKLFAQDPTKLIGDITFTKRAITDLNPKSYPPHYFVKIDQKDVDLVNQIWFVIGKLEGTGKNKSFKPLSIDQDVSFDQETGDISIPVTGKQYCIGEKPIPIYWDNDINKGKDPKWVPMGSFAVKYKGETKFLVVKEKGKNVVEVIGAWNSKDYKGNVIPAVGWLNKADIPEIGSTVTILYKLHGKYVDGPEVKLDSYSITKSCLENGEYAGAFFLEDIVGRNVWSYYKVFRIDSSLEIKGSTAEDSEAPMSEDETL